jgi:hypothetical protein
VLIGRVQLAVSVLHGAERKPSATTDTLKQKLRETLLLHSGDDPSHRDGLLFEIICWVAAELHAGPDEIVSEPHLKSTQQGLDTIKVTFDPLARAVTKAVIFEQKCSKQPRRRFRDEVLPSFRQWHSGERDNQLLQVILALLARANLTDDERVRIYDHIGQQRPLAFNAALTVESALWDAPQCAALFKDFQNLTPALADRIGSLFPLTELRPFFDRFAVRVWDEIESGRV